jgi:hypothetical protein
VEKLVNSILKNGKRNPLEEKQKQDSITRPVLKFIGS